MKIFLKKHSYLLSIILVVLLGFFLRAYNFSDWLHFELDQSRDAIAINFAAEEGIENLPLLGPRAAGSFLRLGPAFYYLGYLSTKIFGNTPPGMAFLTMILGTLTILIFYLFIKNYFDKKISFGLTLLFSTSLFMVLYSRFSWNPNLMPFFIGLTFLSLLKITDKNPGRGIWLIVSSISMAIATQLHFLAFLVMPIIFASYLIIKRPPIKLKYWIISFLAIILIYSPVIINDIETGGKNIAEFKEAVFEKSDDNEKYNLIEKIVKNYFENSADYFLILTAQKPDFPSINFSEGIVCGYDCRKDFPLRTTLSLIIFSTGIILLMLRLFKEKDDRRKNFLILSSLWFGVSFLVFLPIAFEISPRFMLMVSFIPFIFLGLILQYLKERLNDNIFIFCLIILIGVALFSNTFAIKKRFVEMKDAPHRSFDIETDDILKERNRITLEQQYLIVGEIKNRYEKNGFPVYIESEAYYKRSFLYHTYKEKIPSTSFSEPDEDEEIYQNGNYFLIYPTGSNYANDIEGYLGYYDLLRQIEFGTLTLFEFKSKKEAVNEIQEEMKDEIKRPTTASHVPERFTWKEILESK